MQCEQFETELPLLALDELDAERKAAVEAHLAGCPACSAKLADLLATFGLLTEAARRLPETKLSAARRQALTALASRPAARPLRIGIVLRIAAAILISVICAGLFLPSLSRAREESGRANCKENASQIGKAIIAYQEQNGELFPGFAKSAPSESDQSCDSNLTQIVKADVSHQDPNGDFFPALAKSALNQPGKAAISASAGGAPQGQPAGRVAADIDGVAVLYPAYQDNVKVFGSPSAAIYYGGDRHNTFGFQPNPGRSLGSLYPQYFNTTRAFRSPSTEDQPSFVVGTAEFKGRTGVVDAFKSQQSLPREDFLRTGQPASDIAIKEQTELLARVRPRAAGSGDSVQAEAAEEMLDSGGERREGREPLNNSAVFPGAIFMYPAGGLWDEIKARPPVDMPTGQAVKTPKELARESHDHDAGQNVLYVDGGVRWPGANYASNDAVDNVFAEGGMGAKAHHDNGQNVMYFDGHAKWTDSKYASREPSDNIFSPQVHWGSDTDANLWDGNSSRLADAAEPKPAAPPPPPVASPASPPASSVEEAAPAPVFKAGPVNPWMMTDKEALSTFAVDVDTASYSIARNYIARGVLPPPASVRMEEFVNAFDYNYPTHAQGIFTVHAEGGPSPFRPGLTLLKIGVRARVAGREARKPAHFVFVVDASGSMERPDRLPLVRIALKGLLDQLDPQDRVSLVAFQTTPSLVLESAPATEKQRIAAAVDGLRCGGATNLYDGLKLGYETAARAFRPGGTNRVILCSDGVANIGETEADGMLKSVEALRRQGITLTVVGCGYGSYDDSLLMRLADHGDGNYVFVANEKEAQRVFTEEMSAALQPVALDAKIQVAFDPARVRRYRLIGFEKRILAAADFRNDAVGGGAVSSGPTPNSGQSSTGLYELELLPPAEGENTAGDLGTVFVRYRDVETGRVEEISSLLASDIVRKRTAADSPRFLLAACAAEFAELLRGSEHARNGSFGEVISVLEPVVAQLPLDARVRELLTLVQRARELSHAQ